MGEFLKGYVREKLSWGRGLAGYAQGGDSRDLAQFCDKVKYFRGAVQGC